MANLARQIIRPGTVIRPDVYAAAMVGLVPAYALFAAFFGSPGMTALLLRWFGYLSPFRFDPIALSIVAYVCVIVDYNARAGMKARLSHALLVTGISVLALLALLIGIHDFGLPDHSTGILPGPVRTGSYSTFFVIAGCLAAVVYWLCLASLRNARRLNERQS